VTYQDSEDRTFFRKRGFRKIKESCRIALEANYSWVWLDTCCIDKRNFTELNEAINAMYKWYQKASLCIAYLFDYAHGHNELASSSWFTRCWTLQELIAPLRVEFYDQNWKHFGSKNNLCEEIAAITWINVDVLRCRASPTTTCTVAERLSWASKRNASRVEDEAYSLLGLFDLSMPTLYGSGRKAFQMFLEEVLRRTGDVTPLIWSKSMAPHETSLSGLLPRSPAFYTSRRCARTITSSSRSLSVVADGLELDVLTIPYTLGTYLCILDCEPADDGTQSAILLVQLANGGQYGRLHRCESSVLRVSSQTIASSQARRRRKLYVPHLIRSPAMKYIHGFWTRSLQLPGYGKSSHNKLRICSRRDGSVDREDGKISVVRLSADEWGTRGLIHSPVADRFGSRQHLVRWIKLGFDREWCPTIQLGNSKLSAMMESVREATANPAVRPSKRYDTVWSNDWLSRMSTGSSTTEVQAPDNKTLSEEFEARGSMILSSHLLENVTLELSDMRLQIKLSLLERPARDYFKQLYVSDCDTCKIWTLDILKTGDFSSTTDIIENSRDGAYTGVELFVNAINITGMAVSVAMLGKALWKHYNRRKRPEHQG